ncbi:MAG: N-6 DNA methylase [Pseudomonas sp.]|nr:N-6 DNA methylase [Xanthomonadaceae bacterium]MDP2184830.1 N-6 DNA methylase [Xanthomonadales bacterium]MDZ4117165.1 N-6 DNA methylase [Xanthomonadaceae bacterium]MDZ4324521.1 N-6 DNA methylase [Pseudomonas sp.]
MNHDQAARLIALLRSQLNLSQEQLAARLNVAYATINRWELGKSKPQKAQQEAILQLMEEAGLVPDNIGDAPPPPSEVKPERRRRGMAHSQVLGTKPMEQMLWDAACQIRGEKDAPKFKDYLLPLLFIKRLSDVFDDEVQRLAETYGERDTALKVLDADPSLVRFYLPPQTRWPVISGRETFAWPPREAPKTLGEQLTTSVRLLVKANPDLAGVIDTVDFNETRNGEREMSDKALKGIVETFSDPRYRLGLHDVEPDFLGRCYEYLLRKFAEGQGQSAGEFFTPREVGFLMAEILRPRSGEQAYDYACGSFGLLIKLQLVCRRLDPLSKIPLKLYGQELTGSSYAIACMNRIIHDMQGEVLRGDSMRNPKYRDGNALKRFDLIIANPMWNQSFDPAIYENDPFNRFEETGGVTTGKADWAWLQHTVASLSDSGRAAVVLDTGAVTRGSGSKNEDKERNIRRWFVEHDLIDGVILLPDNLFYNTTAAGIIVVLRKHKPKDRKGRIVLVNASREFKKGNPKNHLTDDAVGRIASAYLKGEPLDGLVAVIDKAMAEENDYNLSPSRYLANGDAKVMRAIPEIVAELAALKKDEAKLDQELAKVLAQL